MGYGTRMSRGNSTVMGYGNIKSCQGDMALASHVKGYGTSKSCHNIWHCHVKGYGTSKSCHGDMALASHVMGTCH